MKGIPFSFDLRRTLCAQLVNAIAYLHFSDEMAHGDIKLDNIAIAEKNLKLIDFGSACHITDQTSNKHGTTIYNPPEVNLRQLHSVERSDIY